MATNSVGLDLAVHDLAGTVARAPLVDGHRQAGDGQQQPPSELLVVELLPPCSVMVVALVTALALNLPDVELRRVETLRADRAGVVVEDQIPALGDMVPAPVTQEREVLGALEHQHAIARRRRGWPTHRRQRIAAAKTGAYRTGEDALR